MLVSNLLYFKPFRLVHFFISRTRDFSRLLYLGIIQAVGGNLIQDRGGGGKDEGYDAGVAKDQIGHWNDGDIDVCFSLRSPMGAGKPS